MDLSALSLAFVAGHQVEEAWTEKYQKIFEHWSSIWSQTFQEIHPGQVFFSDQFTRQDEVMGLFYNGECISVCCHRLANLALPSLRKDSYFEVWSDEALLKLRKFGDRIVIDNQISVSSEFRRLDVGFKIIELMTYLTFRHLSTLPISAITAAARNSRSMNRVFEKFQPEILVPEVLYHGEPTTLYALYPGQISFALLPSSLRELGDRLLSTAQRSNLIHPLFSKPKGVFDVVLVA